MRLIEALSVAAGCAGLAYRVHHDGALVVAYTDDLITWTRLDQPTTRELRGADRARLVDGFDDWHVRSGDGLAELEAAVAGMPRRRQ